MTDARRDKIAAALREHQPPAHIDDLPSDEFDCCADAVLKVLPSVPCGCADADRTYAEMEAHHLAEIERLKRDLLDAKLAHLESVRRRDEILADQKRITGQVYTAWWSARIGRARERQRRTVIDIEYRHAREAFLTTVSAGQEQISALQAEVARLSAELGARTTTVAQLRAAHKDVCEERDQALVNEETAKGWRDTAHRERDDARREAADYRRANTMLQEINTIRTGERDRFKDTLSRIRAVRDRWYQLPMMSDYADELDAALDKPEEGTDG